LDTTSIKIKKCWYFVFRKSEEFLHSTKIIRISFHYWSFIQNDKKATLFCYLHLEFTFLQVFLPPIFSPLLSPFLEGKTKIEIFYIKHCVNLNWRVYIVFVFCNLIGWFVLEWINDVEWTFESFVSILSSESVHMRNDHLNCFFLNCYILTIDKLFFIFF
jgi:hypothetical protein